MSVKIEEALATMRAYPKDPQAWLTLGAVLANAGDIQKAKQCYVHALELDPEFSRARTALQALQALEPPPTELNHASSETANLVSVPSKQDPSPQEPHRPAQEPAQVEPATEPAAAPDPAQGIKVYVIPGETLYAIYNCIGADIDIVGITDQRVIFQDQTIVRGKVQVISLPYNHVVAVAIAEKEVTLLTAIGHFSFEFRDFDKADWVYRFIMHQILHQPHPQLPG